MMQGRNGAKPQGKRPAETLRLRVPASLRSNFHPFDQAQKAAVDNISNSDPQTVLNRSLTDFPRLLVTQDESGRSFGQFFFFD